MSYEIGQLKGAFSAGVKKGEQKGDLIGKHFHSFKEDFIHWQGRILSSPSEGAFLVQLYSWFDGCETDQVFVKFDDMLDWKFYDTDVAMNTAYEKSGQWRL